MSFLRKTRWPVCLTIALPMASFAAALFTLHQSLLWRVIVVLPLVGCACLIFWPHRSIGRKLMVVGLMVAICTLCWWGGGQVIREYIREEALGACERGDGRFQVLWYSFRADAEHPNVWGQYDLHCVFQAPNSWYGAYVLQDDGRQFVWLVD